MKSKGVKVDLIAIMQDPNERLISYELKGLHPEHLNCSFVNAERMSLSLTALFGITFKNNYWKKKSQDEVFLTNTQKLIRILASNLHLQKSLNFKILKQGGVMNTITGIAYNGGVTPEGSEDHFKALEGGGYAFVDDKIKNLLRSYNKNDINYINNKTPDQIKRIISESLNIPQENIELYLKLNTIDKNEEGMRFKDMKEDVSGVLHRQTKQGENISVIRALSFKIISPDKT